MDIRTAGLIIKSNREAFDFLFEDAHKRIISQFEKGDPDEAPEHRRQLEALKMVKSAMYKALGEADSPANS